MVVARVDRLARALHVQEAALGPVWRLGATVYAADHGEIRQDNPDDPVRTLIRQVLGAVAEFDRKLAVKRLRDGRRAKAAAGGKGWGRYPYGFSKAGPVEYEQATLRLIHDVRAPPARPGSKSPPTSTVRESNPGTRSAGPTRARGR